MIYRTQTRVNWVSSACPYCKLANFRSVSYVIFKYSIRQPIKIGNHEINIEEKKPSGAVSRGGGSGSRRDVTGSAGRGAGGRTSGRGGGQAARSGGAGGSGGNSGRGALGTSGRGNRRNTSGRGGKFSKWFCRNESIHRSVVVDCSQKMTLVDVQYLCWFSFDGCILLVLCFNSAPSWKGLCLSFCWQNHWHRRVLRLILVHYLCRFSRQYVSSVSFLIFSFLFRLISCLLVRYIEC